MVYEIGGHNSYETLAQVQSIIYIGEQDALVTTDRIAAISHPVSMQKS